MSAPLGTESLAARVAAAPISWGVCEVPGWGHQMARDRVLAEMSALGITATELGPDGFLPDEPAQQAALLGSYGLAAAGGFVPTVLHDTGHDPMPTVARALEGLAAAGAGPLVLAAATGRTGYDTGHDERPELDATGWATLLDNLARIRDTAAGRGVTATLHPHVGTMIERRQEVERVLDDSDIALCLDTGHLLAGGTDPAALVAAAPERVGHAHLKDVDAAAAQRVRSGSSSYYTEVARGMFRPLGGGDLDITGIVGALESAGYRGWYVMEQDVVLDGEPPAGAGPAGDVRASLAHLGGAR